MRKQISWTARRIWDRAEDRGAEPEGEHGKALAAYRDHAVQGRAEKLPAEVPPQGAVVVPLHSAVEINWERQRRGRPLLLTFIAMVVLPTMIAGVYLGFSASNRYVSEFRVAVRSVEPMKAQGLPGLLGLSGMSQTDNDSHAVVQYLQSREGLEELDKAVSLRSLYESPSLDWFSRLGSSESIEGYVRYWRRMMEAYFEASTGTIVVRVSAYRPEDALAIANHALAFSEQLVNKLSLRARNDTVGFAEGEVSKAEARLNDVNGRLRELRDKERILDPRKTAESTLSLAAKLQDQISKLNADLTVQRSYLNDKAPSVVVTKESLAALHQELDRVRSEATSQPESTEKPLTSVIGAFDQLESERVFAEKAYQSALASLETARMDANRQQIYLATIVHPELAQEASFPKPLRQTSMVFGIALALWTIGLLGTFAIREHL